MRAQLDAARPPVRTATSQSSRHGARHQPPPASGLPREVGDLLVVPARGATRSRRRAPRRRRPRDRVVEALARREPWSNVRSSASKSASRGSAGMFSQRCTAGRASWRERRPVVSRAARAGRPRRRRTSVGAADEPWRAAHARRVDPDLRERGAACSPPVAERTTRSATLRARGAGRHGHRRGAVAARTAILAGLARRGVLRPLDELLGADHRLALVLLDELEADAAARLVDLLHDHVEDVAAGDHVLDVVDAARARRSRRGAGRRCPSSARRTRRSRSS